MKQSVIYFICFLFAGSVTGAEISGRVIDNEVNEPLEYASVALYQASNNELITGGVTSQTGDFSFSKISPGSYFIQVQFMGYDKEQSEVFELTDGRDLDLGDIALRPSKVLVDEIAITGTKIQAFNKLEKQMYRADQFESAKGGSAIDVLKNMPSVSVNGLGEISMRGASGFLCSSMVSLFWLIPRAC